MQVLKYKKTLQADDIISYAELVAEERQNLQKGMNYKVTPYYSVFLMSVRKNAPYADEIDNKTNSIIYEGHDAQRNHNTNPKSIDQPLHTPRGTLTENGKFYVTALAYKLGLTEEPHKIKVYEKIKEGIWSYKGFFNLVDAKIINNKARNVFKFYLQPVEVKKFRKKAVIILHSRLIPTKVKLEVWKRDKGMCRKCKSTENLHFDHDLPFSKGGTSLTADNVKILCMKCNLEKSNKIMSLVPLLAVSGL